MRRLALAVAILAAAAGAPGCGDAEQPGPIKELPKLAFGMTPREARAAVGERLGRSLKFEGTADCGYFTLPVTGISGLTLNGRIATFDFGSRRDASGNRLGNGAATSRGLRAGENLARAIALYGRPDRIAASEYGIEQIYWRLPDAGRSHVYLQTSQAGEGATEFDTPDGLYVTIGTTPAVYFPEGCA